MQILCSDQRRLLNKWSGIAERHNAALYTFPLDLISGSSFSTDSAVFCKKNIFFKCLTSEMQNNYLTVEHGFLYLEFPVTDKPGIKSEHFIVNVTNFYCVIC